MKHVILSIILWASPSLFAATDYYAELKTKFTAAGSAFDPSTEKNDTWKAGRCFHSPQKTTAIPAAIWMKDVEPDAGPLAGGAVRKVSNFWYYGARADYFDGMTTDQIYNDVKTSINFNEYKLDTKENAFTAKHAQGTTAMKTDGTYIFTRSIFTDKSSAYCYFFKTL